MEIHRLKGEQKWATAIQHEQFRGGEWIVVRGYDSKEEAEAGHDMWVKSAKAGFQKLYDVFEEKIYPKEKKKKSRFTSF